MAALTTIAAIAGAAAGLAGTGYQVSEGLDAKREAKDAKRDAATDLRNAEAQLKLKRESEERANVDRIKATNEKMRLLQGGQSTRGGTIKTGPLGLIGNDNASYARKLAMGI